MNTERIKAILTIIVTAAVNVANILGYALDMDAVLNCVLTIFSFICIMYSWWFNQNVTDEAQQAQLVLNELKAAKKANHAL
ncbi:MAG: hypothetical protein IKF14_05070 [Atopobiaceae bacterium]|nr:hypothetical protein [Atopobiaceae bacterium]